MEYYKFKCPHCGKETQIPKDDETHDYLIFIELFGDSIMSDFKCSHCNTTINLKYDIYKDKIIVRGNK